MVHIAIERGQQHNRTLPLAAQVAAQRHSVFARQHDIQQYQIGLFTSNNLFGPVAARFNDHVHIMLSQIGGDKRANFGLILNKNDLIHILRV